jgi:hypothetical protein
MSTNSPAKALRVILLTLVLLCVGVGVLVGVFGLLIKLFGGGVGAG